jgi:hypothetical protein
MRPLNGLAALAELAGVLRLGDIAAPSALKGVVAARLVPGSRHLQSPLLVNEFGRCPVQHFAAIWTRSAGTAVRALPFTCREL